MISALDAWACNRKGGEIRGVDRRVDGAQHLAALRFHDLGGIALQCMSERIIGADEKP